MPELSPDDGVDPAPGADPALPAAGPPPGGLVVDHLLPGPWPAGPATVDSDGDGAPDTAVAALPDGALLLASDLDGDGFAEVATRIDGTGAVTASEAPGGVQVTEQDWEGGEPVGPPPPPPSVDPRSGDWVRG